LRAPDFQEGNSRSLSCQEECCQQKNRGGVQGKRGLRYHLCCDGNAWDRQAHDLGRRKPSNYASADTGRSAVLILIKKTASVGGKCSLTWMGRSGSSLVERSSGAHKNHPSTDEERKVSTINHGSRGGESPALLKSVACVQERKRKEGRPLVKLAEGRLCSWAAIRRESRRNERDKKKNDRPAQDAKKNPTDSQLLQRS